MSTRAPADRGGLQVGFPNTDANNAAFGSIATPAVSYSPRVVQLVLRYRY